MLDMEESGLVGIDLLLQYPGAEIPFQAVLKCVLLVEDFCARRVGRFGIDVYQCHREKRRTLLSAED